MLKQITPLILTWNEAPNIARTLDQLRWAHDVVVLDSFSNDETLELVSQFSNVRVFQRVFDNFAAQWQFGLQETGISTQWVLALDADFILTEEMVEELEALQPPDAIAAYRAPIAYCIQGRRLRSSLLPPLTVLYRLNGASCLPDGHTYQVVVPGETGRLRSSILHDDRKPFNRWLAAQQGYTALEGQKLLTSDESQLGLPDRIRRLRVVAPVAVLFYCLILRGGVLDGWAGF